MSSIKWNALVLAVRTMKVNIITESLNNIVLVLSGLLLDIGILLLFFVFFALSCPVFR